MLVAPSGKIALLKEYSNGLPNTTFVPVSEVKDARSNFTTSSFVLPDFSEIVSLVSIMGLSNCGWPAMFLADSGTI